MTGSECLQILRDIKDVAFATVDEEESLRCVSLTSCLWRRTECTSAQQEERTLQAAYPHTGGGRYRDEFCVSDGQALGKGQEGNGTKVLD